MRKLNDPAIIQSSLSDEECEGLSEKEITKRTERKLDRLINIRNALHDTWGQTDLSKLADEFGINMYDIRVKSLEMYRGRKFDSEHHLRDAALWLRAEKIFEGATSRDVS